MEARPRVRYLSAGLSKRRGRKKTQVSLKGRGRVYECDPRSGDTILLPFHYEEGYIKGDVSLDEDEMLILCLEGDESYTGEWAPKAPQQSGRKAPVTFSTLALQEFGPETGQETSFLKLDRVKIPFLLQSTEERQNFRIRRRKR